MCSLISQSAFDDPVGTATSYDHYVIVEAPLPWSGPLEESGLLSKELLRVMGEARDLGIHFRPLAIGPDPEYSVDGHRRLLFFSRPKGRFATFHRREYLVPNAHVASLVGAYLQQGDALDQYDPYRVGAVGQEDGSEVRDIMVCTHGSVDACCGKFGYPVYRELRDACGTDASRPTRVWRVSHIGGHRFAPTLIDFPEGRVWGHISTDALERVVNRSGSFTDVRPHYRGWLGLQTPFEQVTEAAILKREGWAWSHYPKVGNVLAIDDDRRWAHVRISVELPHGDVSVWEAEVSVVEVIQSRGSCAVKTPIEVPKYSDVRWISTPHPKSAV